MKLRLPACPNRQFWASIWVRLKQSLNMFHATVTLRIVHPVVTACRLWQDKHRAPTSTSFPSPIAVRSSPVMPVERNASPMLVTWTAFSMLMFTSVSVLS